MTKKSNDYEMDLSNLFYKLRNRKWTILFTTFFVMSLSYLSLINQEKPKITAEIKIREISVLEESKFRIYNSFIKSIKSQSMNDNQNIIETNLRQENYNKYLLNSSTVKIPKSVVSDLLISNVDKKFLYDLFVIQLKEDLDFINTTNRLKFDKDFLDIFSTLTINQEKKDVFLSFQINSNEKKKFTDFLFLLEKLMNQEIQKKLNLMFNDYVDFIQEIRIIQIEDLEYKYLIANEPEKKKIETIIKLIETDKYIQRLKKIYSDSPLSNINEFHAARLSGSKINFIESNQSTTKIMIFAGVLGLLLGIFISLILNVITKRSIKFY